MAYTKSNTTPGVYQNLEQRLDWIEDGIANAGGTVQVTDGIHTVAATTQVDFTSGATVTDAGGGVANVAISAADTLNTIASSGASLAVDFATANVWDVTLTANCTLALSAVTSGKPITLTLLLRQDATGSRTVTWPSSVTWLSGVTPTLNTAASSLDMITLFTDNGGTNWYGAQANSPDRTTYRKVTSKQVVSTVSETDLLNGEITLAAGVMGTNRVCRVVVWGDWLQNASSTAGPRFGVVLGSTRLWSWQTFNSQCSMANNTTRWPWRYEFTITAANATNAQTASIEGKTAGYTSDAAKEVVLAQMNDNSLAPNAEGVRMTTVTGANTATFERAIGYSSAAEDSTAALALKFLVLNGANSASYDVTLKGAIIEVV